MATPNTPTTSANRSISAAWREHERMKGMSSKPVPGRHDLYFEKQRALNLALKGILRDADGLASASAANLLRLLSMCSTHRPDPLHSMFIDLSRAQETKDALPRKTRRPTKWFGY